MTLSNGGTAIDDLERWFDSYKKQLSGLNFSKNTIELYDRTILQFIEFIIEETNELKILEIRSHHITYFFSYLEQLSKKRGKKPDRAGNYLSNSTKKTYLKAIKGLFSFISDNNDELYSFDRIFNNIKIKDNRKAEEKVKHFSQDEIERILSVIEKRKSSGSYNDYRNALLFKLMLYAGLRISEALNVMLDDFLSGDSEEIYYIEIFGKGGREQFAYIKKKHIEDELNFFRKKIKNDILIMKTSSGEKLHRVSASIIFNRIYKDAGINKTGLHILRHTFAMRLVKKDTNPLIIKRALRQTNIETTMIYARADEEDVAKAI